MRLKLMRSLFERSAVQVDRAEFLKIDACERPPLSANGVRVLGASRIDLNQMGDARFVDGVILRIGQAAEARGEQGSAGAEEDAENFKHWRSERLHVLF